MKATTGKSNAAPRKTKREGSEMGTKLNPGKFDCWANLEPDEPYFVLRSTDPFAPFLVRLWVTLRNLEDAKALEAWHCSLAMEVWRKKHRPDEPPPPSDLAIFLAVLIRAAAILDRWNEQNPDNRLDPLTEDFDPDRLDTHDGAAMR